MLPLLLSKIKSINQSPPGFGKGGWSTLSFPPPLEMTEALAHLPCLFWLFSSIIMDALHLELIKIGACEHHNESVQIVGAISNEN